MCGIAGFWNLRGPILPDPAASEIFAKWFSWKWQIPWTSRNAEMRAPGTIPYTGMQIARGSLTALPVKPCDGTRGMPFIP